MCTKRQLVHTLNYKIGEAVSNIDGVAGITLKMRYTHQQSFKYMLVVRNIDLKEVIVTEPLRDVMRTLGFVIQTTIDKALARPDASVNGISNSVIDTFTALSAFSSKNAILTVALDADTLNNKGDILLHMEIEYAKHFLRRLTSC